MSAVVGPTLIFYVTELGGDKNDYGMMLSLQFLAMLIMTSVYGILIDTNGGKYTWPYMLSFFFGIISYLLYFLLVLIPPGPIAIYLLMLSRFLEGMGAAGRTLAYSWIHAMIPHEKQKTVITILSMSRTIGQIVGPFTNLLVIGINTEFNLFGVKIPVTSLNSIGILMVGSLVMLLILTLVFLLDPPQEDKFLADDRSTEKEKSGDKEKGLFYALTHFGIWFPIFAFFSVICNFSVFITAFSPVGMHAMEWNPIQISQVSAIGSAITFLGMVIAMVSSMNNVDDRWMINFGFACFTISGTAMYTNWVENATYWEFSAPAFGLYFSYPFIGPACRSTYSKTLHARPELKHITGTMLALMNQAISLGGLLAPALVARFILRNPEDVDADPFNKHELTAFALYVPILSVTIIVGLAYQYYFIYLPREENSNKEADAVEVSESSGLLRVKNSSAESRASIIEISDTFSRSSEVSRRLSCEVMGIPNPFDTKYEEEYYSKLLEGKKGRVILSKMVP